MVDSGGQNSATLTAGGAGNSTVEHPHIISIPLALSSRRSGRLRGFLVFIGFQLLTVFFNCSVLGIPVSPDRLDERILLLQRGGMVPIALNYGLYERSLELPLVNPLCDPTEYRSADPYEQERGDDGWRDQTAENFKHGLSPYLAQALGLKPLVQRPRPEYNSGDREGQEDFVYTQTQRLVGQPYASLCLEENSLYVVE